MSSISQICQMIGVTRSTLLYYERIGIISPERNPDNGYRDYSQDDIHALVLIRQLKKAGFSLKEANAIMKGDLDPDLIRSHYQTLEREIQELRVAHELVKSLVIHTSGETPEVSTSDNPSGIWHAKLEKMAGEAHAEWLKRLGFDDKEQLYIRWVTRNLTNSTSYMEDFFQVFEQMRRQGPGSRASTIQAFETIPNNQQIQSILEVGCGKGQSSLALSEISQASITAIDNHQPFLDYLHAQASALGVTDRIKIKNMSMFDMDFSPASFDLIWSEGSAYFMGFEKALTAWMPLLRPGGYLFVSDAVWLTDRPSQACADYFQIEYPHMSTVKARLQEVRQMGYEVVNHSILPQQDWADFYDDMENWTKQSIKQKGMTPAFEKMINEVKLDREYGAEYGYVCLLLRAPL